MKENKSENIVLLYSLRCFFTMRVPYLIMNIVRIGGRKRDRFFSILYKIHVEWKLTVFDFLGGPV